MRGRQKSPQIFQKRGNPPEEHSSIPKVLSRCHVFSSKGKLRLFGETLDCVCGSTAWLSRRVSSFNVAVPRLRPGRRYTEYYEIPG